MPYTSHSVVHNLHNITRVVYISGQERCVKGKNYIYYIISTYIIIYFSYFFFCVLFYTLQGEIIILHDNYPGEDEVYLITVYTGNSFEAGTTANVCIQLHGNMGTSRVN